jgi:hAT family C-terminal dimerisation region
VLHAGPGRGALNRQWGLEWAADTLRLCNKIANFLNDSGPAKAAVQSAQVALYGKKQQITVNVPTRFASNFFVVESIFKSKAALVQAVGAEAWSAAGGPGGSGGTGATMKAIIERAFPGSEFFWENVELLLELLRAFSDAIHQLEADRPMLGQCYAVVMALLKHVLDFEAKYKDKRAGAVVLRLKETFQRRFDAAGGGARAPIYNEAYAAAFMLDPYFAEQQLGGVWFPPAIKADQLPAVVALVQRIGGADAGHELHTLMLEGYPAAMAGFVQVAADPKKKAAAAEAAQAASVGKKRKFAEMSAMSTRVRIWDQYGKEHFPNLTCVVLKLLSCHATTCATERNWHLWGRIYTASRNALGMERAKKMIAICTNTREQSGDDFAVSLAVIDGAL